MDTLAHLSREELLGMLDDFAKNWLAHDGLWFQAVEKAHGMAAAIDADREAWRVFTAIEARRIMQRHSIPAGSGLAGLKKALGYRLYARLNKQSIVAETETAFVFQMNACRVQSARERKGLDDFPCKSVGIVEYSEFACTIDPRIKTECVACPPDKHPAEFHCAWRFTLIED